MSLYDTGIRPLIDAHLKEESEKLRDYGDYWSASSAGYCYRKLIFERLSIPPVTEDARKQRIFSSGDIFHNWIQDITKSAGLSIAQELELQDEELMIKGHVDDLVLISNPITPESIKEALKDFEVSDIKVTPENRLILYDYKTAHSKWFEYAKTKPVSYYNKMQVGTYMMMLRKFPALAEHRRGGETEFVHDDYLNMVEELSESRILKISKDDLRLFEYQVLWTPELEVEVLNYWETLNKAWAEYQKSGYLPACSCHLHENGFLAKEKYNPYFYQGEPCSEAWLKLNKEEVK